MDFSPTTDQIDLALSILMGISVGWGAGMVIAILVMFFWKK